MPSMQLFTMQTTIHTHIMPSEGIAFHVRATLCFKQHIARPAGVSPVRGASICAPYSTHDTISSTYAEEMPTFADARTMGGLYTFRTSGGAACGSGS